MNTRISALALILMVVGMSEVKATTLKPSDTIRGLATNHVMQSRSSFNSVTPINSQFTIDIPSADIDRIG